MTNEELQIHIKSGTPFPDRSNEGWGNVAHVIRTPAAPVVCADGFIMSVQGSVFAYCSPRNNEGPYTHVEVGYPSHAEPMLKPFAEDPDNLIHTVYGYVPVNLVLEVINNHGGVLK